MTQLALNLKVAEWLPKGKSGPWEIRRFKEYDEPCTGLWCDGLDWMNDCQQMIVEHEEFCEAAHGRVVLTGLGIGYVPNWLAQLGRCSRITIVENSPDVIGLVLPHLTAHLSTFSPTPVEVIRADANEWVPDHCDFVWFDHGAGPLIEPEREVLLRNYRGHADNIYFWERNPQRS